MNFFAKNVLLLHLIALVLAFTWIHGGTRADLLFPVVPWLTFFVLEWLLVFPQAKSTETLTEARVRVWRALRRDPLTYVAFAFTIVLVLPLFNVANPPVYDQATQQWRTFAPPVKWLPFCVNPFRHAVLLLWFPPVLTAALATRHGLLKRSKRALLEFVCWNSAALSILGFVQLYSGTHKLLWLTPIDAYFFSVFGYANFAGAFFTLSSALSFGLWFQQVSQNSQISSASTTALQEESSWFLTHRMLLPATLAFFGAIASLSRAAILLSTLITVVLTVYMLAYSWRRVSSGTRMTIFASLFAVVMMTAVVFAVFKLSDLRKEINDISVAKVVERVTGSGLYHARVAKEMFKNYPVFGVGGWGYPDFQLLYMKPDEHKTVQLVGGANVHNDSLQFLAEQGIVGYGLILVCVLLLVIPVYWQAIKASRIKSQVSGNEGLPDLQARNWFERFPVLVVFVTVGAGGTVCHSLGDLPFRDPAVLLVWVLAWCCVVGWMPTLKRA